MDPISAMLVAGLLTVLFTKTAGSAVTDVAAQAKGKTPPSLEKWRGREEKRRGQGRKARSEPGAWQRRMQNAADRSNEKSAQKHQAKLDRLREQAPDNMAAHKDRLDRRQQRRDQARAAVGRFASNSWEQTKAGAAGLRQRATAGRDGRRASTDIYGGDTSPNGDAVIADPADAGEPAETVEQVDPGEHVEQGEAVRSARPASATTLAGVGTVTGELPTTELPDHTDTDSTVTGGDHVVDDPPEDDGLATVTPISHTTPPEQATQEGTTPVSADMMHSGEIMNLSDAAAFTQTTSAYCDKIAGTFEEAQSQAAATAQDVEAMLGTLETAQSSLAGQGLNEAAAKAGVVSEQLSELVNNMQQVDTLLAATDEAINTARATLDEAARTFQEQQGIAEEMSAHREVADNTEFYREA